MGTVAAFASLKSTSPGETVSSRKCWVNDAIATAARELGNTKAVCRQSYIHPGLLSAAISGEFDRLTLRLTTKRAAELSVDEAMLRNLLPKLNLA